MHAKVTVTNLENGRSTALVVNDRGPFVAGRVLDLSYAAAKHLGMVEKGLARVLIRTSEPVPGQKNDDILGAFFIHIGSFEAEQAAMCLREDMRSLNYKHSVIKVIKADRDGEIHWRVELGPQAIVLTAHSKEEDYPSPVCSAAQALLISIQLEECSWS
jgi:rare lipoprotein A